LQSRFEPLVALLSVNRRAHTAQGIPSGKSWTRRGRCERARVCNYNVIVTVFRVKSLRINKNAYAINACVKPCDHTRGELVHKTKAFAYALLIRSRDVIKVLYLPSEI